MQGVAAGNVGMFGWLGRMAMANGQFEEAAKNFTEGLNQVPRQLPHFAATFLIDRSECFWQLCRYKYSIQDMRQAIEIGLPPLDVDDAEDRALKWYHHGKEQFQEELFEISEQCFSFALYFNISDMWKAEILSHRAAAFFFLGKLTDAKRDIRRCNMFRRDLSLNVAISWKDTGIRTFKQRDYQRAVRQLQLARLFNPRQDLEFQRSLLSHMASALFALKDYEKSIETGKECYRLKSTENKSEGERWKDRGNELYKNQNYKLSSECYTLSLNYTPARENNLIAVNYSNRSIAYLKDRRFNAALSDAQNCVKLKPKWSKAHYRVGSSLVALERFDDAMASFTLALAVSTPDEDPTDTLSQILSLALTVEEQTESVTCTVNRTVVQKLVDDAIKNRDWYRLRVLFLGGGSVKKYKRGEGGLATGCNTSSVPLEDFIRSDVEGTEKIHFVKTLVKHGASVIGLPRCKKSPLEVARETEQFEIMWFLHQEGAQDDLLTAEVTSKKFKKEGIRYYRRQDYREAVKLFKKVMEAQKHRGFKGFDDRYEIAGYMADAYFKLSEFSLCKTAGHEMLSMKPEKSQELAEVWKERGNALIKTREKVGNIKWASDFYSLAMSYTDGTNIDTMAKLLSNRSLSYLYDKQYQAAIRDAENCIKLKPDWFRGHFRMGSAFNGLNEHKEALSAFCKSYTMTTRDGEREVVAREIVSTAMQVSDGTSVITCNISTDILDKILEDAVTKQDWEIIRFLFLGDADPRLPTREIQPPLGQKCDGRIVPIEQVMQASVGNISGLVQALLERGALVNGQPECDKAPLAVAAERKDYAMAATLLRHGADSSSIVLECNQEFIARGEKEARYWFALGSLLLKQNREHRNAVTYLNISLELSDPETDRQIRYDAYFNLADEYFELRWYDECLEAGQQCFRLKPEKSEIEAKRWSSRCRTVMNEKRFHFCVEFSTLAIKYVPAAMHKSFVPNMLMYCAYAKMQMKEFHKALDDLKTIVKINPQFPKAYEYQGDCCVELKRPKEAIQAYGKYLENVGKSEKDEDVNRVLRTVISLATESGEGTAAVTFDPPKHIVEKILREIIEKKEWNKLQVMFLGGGGSQRYPAGRGGLASGCGAKSIPLEEIVTANISAKERNKLVSVLVENGVSVNGLSDSCKPPLITLMEQENQHLVNLLLEYGADPGRSTSGGSTPLHFALQLGIDKEKWGYLYALLQRSKFPRAKNAQDKNGHSLFHIASFGRINKKRCKAINILTENGVNPHLRNRHEKLAIDCVGANDGRFKLLQTAMNKYQLSDSNQTPKDSTTESSFKEFDEQAEVGTSAATLPQPDDQEEAWYVKGVDDQDTVVAKEAKQVRPRMDRRQKSQDEMYCKVLNLIEHYDFEEILREYQQAEKTALQHQQEDLQQMDVEEELDEMEEMEEVASEATLGSNILNTKEARDEESMDIDSPFENLPWEVDCTDQVWKVMQSKRVSNAMKKRIIEKIRMLAEGRWNANLCKRLEGTAKRKDICLYEAKLTKGARILWEKTVAFSYRCSQNPELRVKSDDSEGRVYSDIIRVWDIALAHDTVEHKIDNIVRSHDRGRDCIIKTDLKGFKRDDLRKEFAGECLPNYYLEKTEDQKKKEENKATFKREPPRKSTKEKELVELFCPPASANEQEYHILKFYSFNSALVHTILQCDSTRVDFPFKVTEREYDIINLCPSPPSPIILLGRSGTGKTTCCLYRLWREFEIYWKGASKGGPHIPKYVRSEPLQTNDTEEAEVLGASSSQSCTLNCREEVSQGAESESGCYEHLHQLFVTKNSVLCSEVQKNFRELSHACPDAKDHIAEEDLPLPPRFQEIRDTSWPLFINSRDFLLMLDASLPNKPYQGPFFKRADDGTLLRQVEGWGEEDNNLSYIPSEDSDEEEEVEDEIKQTHADADHDRGRKPVSKESDPRREITYNVFRNEIWPKLIKSRPRLNYHPTLVWMEIRSFIKGSAEALLTDSGHLSFEDYLELGRKRAPNFSDDDRRVVYELFQIYQRHRSSNRMFDESDLVFNLQRRLQEGGAPEWSIHRLYVDETQDFTQAELSLLIRCCRHPNDLFFTGDTAQSIMRGIAFRFSDLKSLFYHANKSSQADERRGLVRVPDRLYQLIHNYRSHSGILRLASSVVDLLLHFFPDSFDRLEKDQGLFDGPKPVILESCSLTDLAMILRGNRRQTSRIEFGAHQVVLVASDEARESVPEELRHGLVMTIYEAKGLEFDDVLIYNFFKDSQARKEWRVVSGYVNEMQESYTASPTGLVEIKEDELISKSRPLEFDNDKHKVLNSEFKYLYTAITRARVNVWFFDEDLEARSPMFEYFQKLGLVKVESLKDEEDDAKPLTSMFAERSTAEEWLERGHYFYKKRLWKVAAKCFVFAGEDGMMLRSRAHQQAEDANKLRGQPRKMREEFLKAAYLFLNCGMIEEAEICLHNAKQRHLLAALYQKTRKFHQAAKLYKKETDFVQASACCEMVNDYGQAIEILCQANMFDKAIDVLERYNALSTNESQPKEGIVPPKATRTIERLCFKLADEHFKNERIFDMKAVLARLPSALDRIDFLKTHGFYDEVARAFAESGKPEEAAQLLMVHGKFKEASRLSSKPKFVADCLMALARTSLAKNSNDLETVLEHLKKAQMKYEEAEDKNGLGDALLLSGKVQRNVKVVEAAGRTFNSARNDVGEAETVEALFELTNNKVPDFQKWILVRTVQRLLSLIHTLAKPAKLTTDYKTIATCERHFGLASSRERQDHLTFLPNSGCRFTKLHSQPQGQQTVEEEIRCESAQKLILRSLANLSVKLVRKIRCLLQDSVSQNKICRAFSLGFLCTSPSCVRQHTNDSRQLFNTRFHSALNLVRLDAVVSNFVKFVANIKEAKQLVDCLMTKDVQYFKSCEALYGMIFPEIGMQGVHLTPRHLIELRTNSIVKQQIIDFAEQSWENAGPPRRINADNFIRLSSILHIISYKDRVKKWVYEEEREFERETKKKKKTDPSRNGMVEDEQRRGRFNSFLGWWEDGKNLTHVLGDVVNSAHFLIRRFLSLPARRCSMPLPSLANTLMILEYQLTACLAMCSRLNVSGHYPVCLPESYLKAVDIWNMVNCTNEKHFELYDAIDRTARSARDPWKIYNATQSLLKYVVELTCGVKYERFDVVAGAFINEDGKHSYEMERTLVFALTMLCNSASNIPAAYQSVILKSMWKINLGPQVSSRIKDALQSLKKVTKVSDVVELLKKFLSSRHESLFDLQWNGRFKATASVAMSYPAEFDFDVSSVHADCQESGVEQFYQRTDSKEDDNEVAIQTEESEANVSMLYKLKVREEREKADREAAALIIQLHFRRRKKAKKQEQLGEPPAEVDLRQEEGLFSKFAVDDSTCGICGVSFIPIYETKDFVEADTGTEENFTLGGDLLRQDLEEASQRERNSHIASSSHIEKEEKFTLYKNFYNDEVLPLLQREQRLHLGDDNEVAGNTKQSQVEGLDRQRLLSARSAVTQCIHQIEESLQWAVTKELHDAIGKFRGKIEEVENLVNEVTDNGGASSSLTKEEDEFAMGIEEDDAEDDELKDIPGKNKAKGKQINKRNRNRKKHKKR